MTMTKEQLQGSIDKVTEAIKLIMETEGYGYNHANDVVRMMADRRTDLQKRLTRMEMEERRTERKLQELETEYSELSWTLNSNEDYLSDSQQKDMIANLDMLEAQIKALRGEKRGATH